MLTQDGPASSCCSGNDARMSAMFLLFFADTHSELSVSLWQGGSPQHTLSGGSGWRGEPGGAGRELLQRAAGPGGLRQHEQRRATRVGVSTWTPPCWRMLAKRRVRWSEDTGFTLFCFCLLKDMDQKLSCFFFCVFISCHVLWCNLQPSRCHQQRQIQRSAFVFSLCRNTEALVHVGVMTQTKPVTHTHTHTHTHTGRH